MFVDFTDEEKNDVLNDMVTKKYNLFLSWYNEEGTYNEDAIQQDKLTIINYLQNKAMPMPKWK